MEDPRESPPRIVEQRRSRRFSAELTVFLHTRERHHPALTVNVARHGLLVAGDLTLRPRHLVQLTIHLPDAPIRATASVARTVKLPVTGLPAMGLQFFALSAESKRRWDRYVSSLGTGASEGVAPLDDSVTATFLIKFKDRDGLREYTQDQVASGKVVLHTPVFRAVGEEVMLVLVHPNTDEELGLPGRVLSVNRKRPKHMVIALLDLDARRREAVERFVDTGVTPREDAFQYAPPGWRPDGDTGAPPQGLDVATGDELTGDVMLSDEPVLVGELVGPWEVGEKSDEPGAVTLEVEAPRGLDPQAAAGRVRAECNACGRSAGALLLGDLPGVLAPVVELCPVSCAGCKSVSSVRRLKPAAGRQEELAAMGGLLGGKARATVPMSMIFEVAALGGPALCPRCGSGLRLTPLVSDVTAAIGALRRGEETVTGSCPCHHCRRGTWVVRLMR